MNLVFVTRPDTIQRCWWRHADESKLMADGVSRGFLVCPVHYYSGGTVRKLLEKRAAGAGLGYTNIC